MWLSILIEKNGYKSVKTALLLSNVIDVDHQNSCLFTIKGHFSSPLWVLSGVLAKFYVQYFINSSNWTLEIYFTINSVCKNLTHMTTMLSVGSL